MEGRGRKRRKDLSKRYVREGEEKERKEGFE